MDQHTQPSPSAVNRAVVLFLGFETASSPRADRGRLIQEFGAERAAELESRVASVLDDLGGIQINWSMHSLATAADFAIEQTRARHPELSEEAVRALKWKFTFEWR